MKIMLKLRKLTRMSPVEQNLRILSFSLIDEDRFEIPISLQPISQKQ
jgi:hypothetical protein